MNTRSNNPKFPFSRVKSLFPQGGFAYNVLTLLTGSTLAQAITIGIAPVLTRLFSPEDFGVMALYVAVSSIISVWATGKYELAIVLPSQEEDAINITILTLLITVVMSLIFLFLVLFFNSHIATLLGNAKISLWLYLIPASVLFVGTYETFYYWFIRKTRYTRMTESMVVRSTIMGGGKVLLGSIGMGAGGLVMGTVGGQAAAAGLLGLHVWKKDGRNLKYFSLGRMRPLLKLYSNFPKYTIPAEMLSVLAHQLPVMFFGRFFDIAAVGYFYLALSVVGTPISLLGNSIRNVFAQRASRDYASSGNCSEIYIKTFKFLTIIAGIPFFALFFIAPGLFAFIFGSEWKIAGDYLQILIPMYFLKFIANPLGYIYFIAQKQREDFGIHCYIGVSTLVVLLLGYSIWGDIKYCLILFSLNYSFVYVVYLARSFYFAKGTIQNN